MKILYVEDELSLAKVVRESLQSRAYEVLHLQDGAELMVHYEQFKPDICLFDVMLPVKDGFALAKELRTINPDIPIIFITSKVQTQDVLKGFGVGGNDYIKKPFSLEELIVRINNMYNLTNSRQSNSGQYVGIGQYEFWPDKLELIYKNEVRRISYREAQLLSELARAKNEIVNRKYILDKIWGDDSFFNSRNLDVYITRLRQFFRNDPNVQIITLKAVGYRLVDG
ncbi:MAG: response regulator transcription factor [Saprospiraceae bacterium]|nr:response regulator transcription factor [Saprospiraceae bacterium]